MHFLTPTTLLPLLLAATTTTASAIPLTPRQLTTTSTTANDITAGTTCAPVTYIFARGTTETGNMGSTVGPALQSALASALGAANLATQGVNYPADAAGTAIGSISPAQAQGSQNCAALVKQVLGRCAGTQIVLAGYSQGAQQVHGCLINLSADEAKKVAAAVTFGDPLQAQKFQNIEASRTKVFCAVGDLVCSNQFIITPAHLSYASQSIAPAVEFIQSQLGSLSSASSTAAVAAVATAATSSAGSDASAGSSAGTSGLWGSWRA